MKRKSLLIIATTLILATVLNMFAGLPIIAADSTVIEISTADELKAVANDLTGNYKLIADIDLNGTSEELTSWTSFGDFTGTFDGNGYTISGFICSPTPDDTSKNAGLFSSIGEGGCVKNLRIANAAYWTAVSVFRLGAIAGYISEGATVSNCIVNSDVTVKASGANLHTDWLAVGGIVGYCQGTVEYCVSYATVSTGYVKSKDNSGGFGGIVGDLPKGTVRNCINNGPVNITGGNNPSIVYNAGAGGIVGIGSRGGDWGNIVITIENCVNNGTVNNGKTYAGGILGSRTTDKTINFNNNYNFGTVTANDTYAPGQLIGYSNAATAFNAEGNYGVGEVLVGSGDANTGMGNDTADVLKEHANYQANITRDISTVDDLKLSTRYYDTGLVYALANDIDLGGMAWTPVIDFSGTFDGNGHAIKNFIVSDTTTTQAGFFAHLIGTVKNLTISNATIYTSAQSYQVGAIAGQSAGTIINCKAASNVIITTYKGGKHNGQLAMGGILGYSTTGSTIAYCENNATVNAAEVYDSNGNGKEGYVGGIVGYLANGSVSYSVNNGSITIEKGGKTNQYLTCGGIAGATTANWASAVTLESCINNGTVANNIATGGGIIGTVFNNKTTSINNNFNFGNVSGNKYNGQIIAYGNTGDNITIANNYGADIGIAIGGTNATSCGTILSAASIVKLDAYKALAADLNAKGIFAALAATDFVGHQTSTSIRDKSETDTTQVFDIRLVSVIGGDISGCQNVGYKVEATYGGQSKSTEMTMTTVYSSISGVADTETVEYTAAELDGDYLFVLVCKNLPTDVDITFTITTFYTDADGKTVSSAAESITVNSSSVPGGSLSAVND